MATRKKEFFTCNSFNFSWICIAKFFHIFPQISFFDFFCVCSTLHYEAMAVEIIFL